MRVEMVFPCGFSQNRIPVFIEKIETEENPQKGVDSGLFVGYSYVRQRTCQKQKQI